MLELMICISPGSVNISSFSTNPESGAHAQDVHLRSGHPKVQPPPESATGGLWLLHRFRPGSIRHVLGCLLVKFRTQQIANYHKLDVWIYSKYSTHSMIRIQNLGNFYNLKELA